MKLRIGDFEVKIKAREIKAPRYTRDSTALFLMEIMEKLHDASHRERKKGNRFTAEESKGWAYDIHKALQNIGYIKKVEDEDELGKQ